MWMFTECDPNTAEVEWSSPIDEASKQTLGHVYVTGHEVIIM